MKRHFLLIFMSLQIMLAGQKKQDPPATATYKIIASYNNTWGYDIFNRGKLFVHQPHIPGLDGNEGFKTKTAAQLVAKLVINKINKGEMPPTVTIDEMKKLKAL